MNKIFEPRPPLKVKDLSEINIEELLKETFTSTIIQTETRNKDGTQNAVSTNLTCEIILVLIVYVLVLFDTKGSSLSQGATRITYHCSTYVSVV